MDKTTRLLQRLDDSRSPSFWRSDFIVVVIAILYGCVVYRQGPGQFILYCGILAVLFVVWSRIEAKQKKQTELIKEILEELNKTKTKSGH